jgi:hypothetical protein
MAFAHAFEQPRVATIAEIFDQRSPRPTMGPDDFVPLAKPRPGLEIRSNVLSEIPSRTRPPRRYCGLL